MKTRYLFLIGLFVAISNFASAQGGSVQYILDATTTGTTVNWGTDGSLYVRYNYGLSNDYTITVQEPQNGTMCAPPYYMSLTFEEFEFFAGDTVFVYDGATTAAPLIIAATQDEDNLAFKTLFVSPTNTSRALTIRVKTVSAVSGDLPIGFNVLASCKKPCESLAPEITDTYYKTRNGEVYDTCQVKITFDYVDTNFTIDPVTQDTIFEYDSVFYRGVELCLGDGVIFTSNVEYSNLTGHYTPTDSTTRFTWAFGNGQSEVGMGLREVHTESYTVLDCYTVTLNLEDERGCINTTVTSVKVRLAQNPIKTIFDLATICNVDSILVNFGYEGANGTLTLQEIEFEKQVTKTNPSKTFIPDGPYCPTQCFSAPVEFNEFPSRTVTSAGDICSICVNYEHEFMGDYQMSIVCPNGQKSVLKYKNAPAGLPSEAGGGGGKFTGLPYGGNGHHSYDGGTGEYCDSIYNMFGVGYDYCFSRNGDYTLVDGSPANTTNQGPYISSNGNDTAITDYVFQTIPAPYVDAGQTAPMASFSTRLPSKHDEKYDYYMPADDFSQLIGCPLNGIWEIEICDTWGADNGWVFEWSLDICGVSVGEGCEYQVAVDSVTWRPDPMQSSISPEGEYRGLVMNQGVVPNTVYISSPDTAGAYRVLVSVYDEFGCVWDTNTNIKVAWTPTPDLGPDTTLCDVQDTYLDGSDPHAIYGHYTYQWAPFGETTDSIVTQSNTGSDVIYTVEVTNNQFNVNCVARDSILVHVAAQPVPSFDLGVYPMEGCEPFTINVTNYTSNAYKHHWDFGDGNTSDEAEPKHTYAAGVYNFEYFVASQDGCEDSLKFDSLITVYPSPKAAFSWEPVYPTVMNPNITLINQTVPMIDENKYYWEIQYDKDAPYSVHTLTDVHPTFTWESDGEDISGPYIVRLIVRNDIIGPSGTVNQCRDTVENSVLVVNDFLQFPNLVTANGDGVNDRFVIVGLVDGYGYPINQLDIYNKWGARVFHKENINSDEDFWDPAADNIPAGTYFYRFSGRGFNGNVERNGCVEVLR